MAKLIVAIPINGYSADDLRKEIEAARGTDDSWWDGDKLVVDIAELKRANDDSFFEFEYRGVEDD